MTRRLGHLSRRALINSGLRAVVSLSTLAWSARAAFSATNGDTPSALTASTDRHRHLTVEVLINAQGPFQFVVDTGADRTVLARDVAERLGLINGPEVMVEGIVQTVSANTVRVRELSFGPVRKEALDLPILPRFLLGADGYLGLDAIEGQSVTFDFVRHELKVERDKLDSLLEPFDTQWNKTRVPARGSTGHLKSLDCKIDGVRAAAFIDSGAEVTIGNSALAKALFDEGAGSREVGRIPITGVTGGQMEGRIISINKVRMGGLRFVTPILAIADLQIFDLWGLTGTPALLMGMNYLRSFAQVTVDYGRNEFRFQFADISESAGTRRA